MDWRIMMPEYIERKVVLAKAAPVEGCFSNMISVYDVAAIPAADVAPVVHGRWIAVTQKVWGVDWSEEIVCSECGTRIPEMYSNADSILQSECKFCHFCGARMDGE